MESIAIGGVCFMEIPSLKLEYPRSRLCEKEPLGGRYRHMRSALGGPSPLVSLASVSPYGRGRRLSWPHTRQHQSSLVIALRTALHSQGRSVRA